MNKKVWKITAILLCMVMLMGQVVWADSVSSEDAYVSLGADLSAKEKATVLKLLGINNINDYKVEYITNKQEHQYLDDYLEKSVIGSRALSSVFVKSGGDGINVETYNITYCTAGMYRNALATAGMENAEVVVAGPFNISGTAALVGAMKAYESMTGKKVSQDNLDAANQELVVTGDVADSIGDDEAEQLIALVKDKVVSGDLDSKEDIADAVEESAEELNVTLSDEDKQQIEQLMQKISDLDLDVNQLKEQAKDIYNKLENLGINVNVDKSFIEKLKSWFFSLFDFLK
ncbi:MAG: DUF1002 domain-containing protein [Lachnospiraceae bacterium]|nr:DUF1002 domain-containing protein [Lachnospiraceae bacterium]